jgi:hypothetical protein
MKFGTPTFDQITGDVTLPVLVDSNDDLRFFKFTIEYVDDCFADPAPADVDAGAALSGIPSGDITIQSLPSSGGQFFNTAGVAPAVVPANRRIVITVSLQNGEFVASGTNLEIVTVVFNVNSTFCNVEACCFNWDENNEVGSGSTQPPCQLTTTADVNILPSNLNFGTPVCPTITSTVIGEARLWRVPSAGPIPIEQVDITDLIGGDSDATMNSGPTGPAVYELTVTPACADAKLSADKAVDGSDDDTILGSDALACWDHVDATSVLGADGLRAGNVTQQCVDGSSNPITCCDLNAVDLVELADCDAIERFILDPLGFALTHAYASEWVLVRLSARPS